MTTRKYETIAAESCETRGASPERKRTRLDPTIIDQLGTTLATETKKYASRCLDVYAMADVGVGRLVDSDNEELAVSAQSLSNLDKEEKECRLAHMLQSTISKDTLSKISQGCWDGMLSQKPVRELIYRINPFQYLPDEVVLQIFWWLPKNCLSNVALVCRRFHRLAQDESLWTRLDMSYRYLDCGALGHILSRQVMILRLANTEISSPIVLPSALSIFKDFRSRLLYLDLSMAHIVIDDLQLLVSKCRRLKKLSLEHCQVDDGVLEALSANANLEVVNFVMCRGLKIDGLRFLLERCKKLKEVNLGWTDLDEACIDFVCLNLPNTIDRLNMSGCRKLIKNKNVSDLVKNCPSLRELDLSDCTGLTDEVIGHIIRLDRLNFLALSRCYFIHYRALFQLKRMDSLLFLDLHGGYLEPSEMETLKTTLGSGVQLNKFVFSSVARPTVGPRRSSIWGLRVRD